MDYLVCPWEPLRIFGLPNVNWCEQARCSWIEAPSNTWSNLAYIAIGIAVLADWAIRRRALWYPQPGQWLKFWVVGPPIWSWSPGEQLVALLGPYLIALGILSGFYHASNLAPTQLLDYWGMYLIVSLVILGQIARSPFQLPFGLGGRHNCWWSIGLSVFLILGSVGLSESGIPYQASFMGVLAIVFLTERRLRHREVSKQAQKYFWISVGLFVLAAIASLVDVTRLFCMPSSWVQGHALWHVLTALSIGSYYRFFKTLF